MSAWLDSMIGRITIEERGDQYVFKGVRTRSFIKHIGRMFGTVRFSNGMLNRVTGSSFQVSRFFLYDFYNIIKTIENEKSPYYDGRIITKIAQEMRSLEVISRTTKTFPSRLNKSELYRFPVTPLDEQMKFFDHYDQITQQYGLKGYILAGQAGTGKTHMSLMLMAMRGKDITIVFSPNNALDEVWRDTINSIEGTKVWTYPEPMDPRVKYTHYVFSHENTKLALPSCLAIFKNNKNSKIGIIVDECHRFNEMSSNMSQNLIQICSASGSEDILFMSGTPFKAMGRELLPFIKSTDPTFSKEDEEGFKKIFGASGNSALEILSARIGRVLYIILKSSVVDNKVAEYLVKVKVPGGERYTLPVLRLKMEEFIARRTKYYTENMTKFEDIYLGIVENYGKSLTKPADLKEFKEYKNAVSVIRRARDYQLVNDEIKFANLYEKTKIIPTLNSSTKVEFRDVKSIYKYLPLKIQGEALGRILGEERTMCNVDIVKHIDKGTIFSINPEFNNIPWELNDIFDMSSSKVVMFTDYIEALKMMSSVAIDHGYQPVEVYGETNPQLTSILRKMETDPKVNPLIATYKSLSTAVPLIMCDTAVLLNSPFRDHIRKQATARVDRLGQKNPVKIFTYVLDTGEIPNISTRSKDIMEWSRDIVNKLLGLEEEAPLYDVDSMESTMEEFHSQFSEKKTSLIMNW